MKNANFIFTTDRSPLLHLQEVLKSENSMRATGIRDIWVCLYPAGFIAAEVNGLIVGVASLSHTNEIGELHKLYIAPDYRGLGIARELTARAVSHLSSLGATEILIEPTDESSAFWNSIRDSYNITDIDHRFFILV